MNCINCNEPIDADWDECPACGTPTGKKILCPNCSSELKSNWIKCPKCKTPTGFATPTPSGSGHSKSGGQSEGQYSQRPQGYSDFGPLTGEPGQKAPVLIDIPVGQAIGANGRYVIKAKLGQGGFGTVYQARDSEMDEEVALKVMPLVSQERFETIKNEYKARKKFRNLEHILGGETPQKAVYQGQPVIIYPMELADGGSLREKIAELKEIDDQEEREEEAKKLFMEMAAGVQACHEAGIVHMDIKPENFLFHEDVLKITDFGISRGAVMTDYRDGTGTAAYMAPEQHLAANPEDVDERADVYALGVILYEMLSGGKLPYAGGDLWKKKREIAPKKIKEISGELWAVIERSLQADPEERYETVAGQMAALETGDASGEREENEEKEPEEEETEGNTESEEDKNGVAKPDEECYLNEDEVWEKEVEVEGVVIKMIYIPAGEFMMGAADDDEDAGDHERPRHKVVIGKGFWLGKYPVTQGQWAALTKENPSHFKEGADHPVEQVNSDDIKYYMKKLNARSRQIFRLPTEAEWEYACRAGSEGKYCYGDDEDDLGEYAWYGENADDKTHPVGEKRPNKWGLYDIHGNVWEYCQEMTDPRVEKRLRNRNFDYLPKRGGSWNDYPLDLRASEYYFHNRHNRNDTNGFRLALGHSSA